MTPLLDYRLKLGLNQEEMARKLGIPRPTLCAYENGDRNPSVERALHIEVVTEGELTREILRPDIYLRESAAS